MKSFIVGTSFTDLNDVYISDDGDVAILTILVPYTSNSRGETQNGFQSLPRFGRGAPYGQVYWALYTPFSNDLNADSRIQGDVMSIVHPIMEGPYQLGVNGPAVFHNQEPVGPDDDQPDGDGTPLMIEYTADGAA